MSGIPGPRQRGMIPRSGDARQQPLASGTTMGGGGCGAGGARPPRGARSGLPVTSTGTGQPTGLSRLRQPRTIPGPSAGGGGGIPRTGNAAPCGPETGAVPRPKSAGFGLQTSAIQFKPKATSSTMSVVTKSSARKVSMLPLGGQSEAVGRGQESRLQKRMPVPKPRRVQEESVGRGQSRPLKKQLKDTACGGVDEQAEWDQARATTSRLEDDLEATLRKSALQYPKTRLIGTRSRKTVVPPPMIMTEEGPVKAQMQVITTQSVRKQPGQPDIIGRDITAVEMTCDCAAEQTEVVMSSVGAFEPHGHHGHHSPAAEAVIVQSKVSIAPGVKQTIKTVTYEGDPTYVRHAPVLPSPREVARLVREESKLIDDTMAMHMPEVKRMSPTTYPLRKKSLGYSLDKETVGELESHALCSTCVASPQPQAEVTPEIIAEIMNTEERGLAMGETPENVYNYLFASGSDAAEEQKVQVTSVAAYPFTDVVVPAQLPDMSKDVPNIEDVQNVTIQAVSSLAGDPDATTYCAVVGDEPLECKNTAKLGKKTKRKRVTPISKEQPPWGAIEDDKVETVVDLVGGALAESRVVREERDEEVDPFLEGIEYILQMEAPSHFTQVQLRGTQKPDWFPGYLMALPGEEKLVVAKHTPEEVFAAAWRATQPDIFNDDSVFVI